MKTQIKKIASLGLLGLLAAHCVRAGASTSPDVSFIYIPFTAPATAIPTLSGWTLIGVSFVTALIAARHLKIKSSSKVVGGIFLALSLAVAVFSGADFLTKAIASTQDSFSNSSGGSFDYSSDINPADTWTEIGGTCSVNINGQEYTPTKSNVLTNTSGVTLKITSVVNNGASVYPTDTNSSDYSSTTPPAQQCVSDLTLPAGQSCQVIVLTPCA